MNKFLFLLILCFACNNNTHEINKTLVSNDTSYSYSNKMSPNEFMDKLIKANNSVIAMLADSINSIENEGVFPKFLENPNFDIYNELISSINHEKFSFRFEIIKHVSNKASLLLILNSNNKAYDLKPKKIKMNSISFPYEDFSLNDLVKARLSEMKQYNL